MVCAVDGSQAERAIIITLISILNSVTEGTGFYSLHHKSKEGSSLKFSGNLQVGSGRPLFPPPGEGVSP